MAIGQSATLRGIVLNELNEPLEGVNVVSDSNGTTTNINGFYILKIPANTEVKIRFSHLNYKYLEAPFNLKNGEELEFNPVLKSNYEQIETVIITGSKRKELEGITTISPQIIRTIKGAQPDSLSSWVLKKNWELPKETSEFYVSTNNGIHMVNDRFYFCHLGQNEIQLKLNTIHSS